MSSLRTRTACLSLLLAIVCAAPLAAQSGTAAVGTGGEVYTVLEGSYTQLFPNRPAPDADPPALALDIAHSDGTEERLLVPETETSDTEDSASLFFEDGSDTLFILWQTKFHLIHSKLSLVSYKEGEWSSVVEIWGSQYGWKTSPQLTVTRDIYKILDENGDPQSLARTVVHVVWSESRADGLHSLYSPIVLIDGIHQGRSPVYDLSELATSPSVESAPGAIPEGLAGAVRVRPGRNAQTIVIGFPDQERGRLVSLEIEILPGEVAHLADRLGHQIIEIGHDLFPDQPGKLAERLGHQIIEIGRSLDLHPGLTAYSAAVVEGELLRAAPDEPLNSLADRLGHQIIEIGARMTDRGVDRFLSKSGYRLLSIPIEELEDVTSRNAPNLVRVTSISSLPAPTIEAGEGAEVSLLLSRTGVDILVAWQTEQAIRYLESKKGGWTGPYDLQLGAGPGVESLEKGMQMLRRRAESLHHEAN